MSNLFDELELKLAGKEVRIVLPEGMDSRVLTAAVKLASTDYVKPIVLGDQEEIEKLAASLNLSVENLVIINPKKYEAFDTLVEKFVERRKGKATEEQARELLLDENYFGTMLVYVGEADGLVSGAIHSTGDTVRPALQIIKTKPGVSRTSGAFIMVRGEEKLVFSDCAINPQLESQELAEIAIESIKTARSFSIDPKVAMLSYSTAGSAKTEDAERVRKATEIAQSLAPDEIIDGEIQFDAAYVPEVAELKAPSSPLKGAATVYVFPSLEAGNIGYKMAQRFGGFEAIGPILQGLNAPVNDLSRGCSAEDVYRLSLISAVQSLEK